MDVILLSGRKFAIKCDKKDIIEIKEGFSIVSICITYKGKEYLFKVNHYASLVIENGMTEKFLIKEIKKSDNPDYMYIVCSSILTKAYYFMLPLLFGNFEDFNANGYMSNVYYDALKKEISLLYRDHEVFCKNSYAHIRKNRFYKSDIAIANEHRLFALSLPDNREIEELCYLEGRYSDLPDTYKKRIIGFFKLKEDHEVSQVLCKSDKLRQKMMVELNVHIPTTSELMSKPRVIEEVFNEDMIESYTDTSVSQ